MLGNKIANKFDILNIQFPRTVSKNCLRHVALPSIGELHTIKLILTPAFFKGKVIFLFQKVKMLHLHYFPTFDSLKNKVEEALFHFKDLKNEILSLWFL